MLKDGAWVYAAQLAYVEADWAKAYNNGDYY